MEIMITAYMWPNYLMLVFTNSNSYKSDIFYLECMSNPNQNVGSYLIQRLYDYGIHHVFGVPGDFILGFYQSLKQFP